MGLLEEDLSVGVSVVVLIELDLSVEGCSVDDIAVDGLPEDLLVDIFSENFSVVAFSVEDLSVAVSVDARKGVDLSGVDLSVDDILVDGFSEDL